MNLRLHNFTRRYLATLRKYLRQGREAVLEEAYELGRAAIAGGPGVLDMARIHGEALARLLPTLTATGGKRRPLKAAETFFLQTLSPFEAAHRGFRETNLRLQQLIATLEKRNAELARTNRRLELEFRRRERTERALQASEARLRAILDRSRAVIFLKDTRGRYLQVNPRFERLFRLRRDQVIGRTDRELFPRQQAAVFTANDRKVLRAGAAMEFEEAAKYHDGVHTSIVSKFPLRDANGRIYALCGIATDITRRKRAEEALRRSEEHHRRLFNEAQGMQEKLRNLSNQILHVQEEERKHISRELHDEVGQHLTAISVMLAALRNNGAGKSEELVKTISGIQRLLEATMETVHNFARELRPAILDELGLLPALRSCLNAFAQRTGLRVSFRGSPLAETLAGEQKTVLFRVAQESLTNVAKHAQATHVRITLRKSGGHICMAVADNGKSFPPDPGDSARRKQGLGLLGMQERVRLVNGRFRVKPEPGKGTSVLVAVPFKAAEAPQRSIAVADRLPQAGYPVSVRGAGAQTSST